MPSYRKDRPSGGAGGARPGGPGGRPTSFRHEEPEEEGEVFPRSSLFRREGGPSEFASRPVSPSERRELWEVLVPKSEQEDPYFDYGKVFEVLRPVRGGGGGGAPRGYEGPRSEAPRGEAPRGAAPGPQRPTRQPGGEPLLDAALFFDLGRIWNAVAALRQDPRFKKGSPVAVVRTAPQNEVHRFFRIPPEDVTYFLEELSYSINAAKPRELPGRFLFQKGADGFVWLAYVE